MEICLTKKNVQPKKEKESTNSPTSERHIVCACPYSSGQKCLRPNINGRLTVGFVR